MRVVWRDVGLDPAHGVLPGPFGYRVETETAPGEWVTVLDRSGSDEDLLCDYRALPAPVRALRVRLVVASHPQGIEPGVIDFTAFGPPSPPPSDRGSARTSP